MHLPKARRSLEHEHALRPVPIHTWTKRHHRLCLQTSKVDELLGLGFAMARDKLVLERLKEWVRLYVFPQK